MTTHEMHIEVAQGLQLVASNRSRKLFDEEIDWALNKIQDRFIQSKLRPKRDSAGQLTGGFEVDQLSSDAIRTLLVQTQERAYVHDALRYRVLLPADYAYLISDSSLSQLLCGALPIEGTEYLYVTRLKQSFSAKGAKPFYETLAMVLPDRTFTLPADLPYGHQYAGYPEKRDISFLLPYIQRLTGWYWERFEDLWYPGNQLQVTKSATNITVPASTYTVDGTTITDTSVTMIPKTYHLGTGSILFANRLVSSELTRTLNQSSFQATQYRSPISELRGNSIYIYRDNSFIVSGVELTYVRKPQPISLSLGTDCELPRDFHSTICDLTVEYLKGVLENERGAALTKTDLSDRVIL